MELPPSSSPPASPPPAAEPAAVVAVRVLVTGGGAIWLASLDKLPPWGVLIVLACLAIPAEAGTIVRGALDVLRGRR